MERELIGVLQEKLADATSAPLPKLTRREIRLPQIPDKAIAVIGMRRSGKTCFLWQCLGDLQALGAPRESLVLLNFEDERLAGIDASALTWLLEEYYRMYPHFRGNREVVFLLDEIQVIPGWERFARRILDSERVRLFLSGSSAAMLSREVATSMRGRAMETRVYPFSFREFLLHRGELPDTEWQRLPKAHRSTVEKAFRDYLTKGGFPEAQDVEPRDRQALLRGYVDVAILRDVIERHRVTNTTALRWLQRHLMASPAAPFSIQKFYDALKSQGIPVSKDTLHAFLAHLEDTFLIRTTSLHTASERQRMVNPRKAYPIDPGLIPIYERTRRPNLGHALETAVFIELERRGCIVHYARIPGIGEIDFHVTTPDGESWLIQVCASAHDRVTWERELCPLEAANKTMASSRKILLLLDPDLSGREIPSDIEVLPAVSWFLDRSTSY